MLADRRVERAAVRTFLVSGSVKAMSQRRHRDDDEQGQKKNCGSDSGSH
jgi:hypothetical protein